ncbi:hypothetical protein ACQWF3_26370, partial [Salmonella enterica subsp. enterica serovar Infantis]
RYGTRSLASDVSQAELSWSGRAHSAVAVAVMTARVLNDIAEYWRVLQCEYNTADGDRSGGGGDEGVYAVWRAWQESV